MSIWGMLVSLLRNRNAPSNGLLGIISEADTGNGKVAIYECFVLKESRWWAEEMK